MSFLTDLKYTFTTRSRKRTHIFLAIGAFLLILIIVIIVIAATSGGSSKSKNKIDNNDNDNNNNNIDDNSDNIDSDNNDSDEGEEGKTPFESYLSAKKYLYVWEYPNAENLIKFLVDHKFSKIYLYVGCVEWDVDKLLSGNFHNAGDIPAKELIQKLIEKNIEVELCIYLNDSPNNFANVDKMPQIAKALSEVQKTLKFTALHFDVEPQNKDNLEKLLHMYEDCRKFIKVSAILKPGWLNQKMSGLESYFTSADYYKQFKDCETFVDAIMTVSDYTDLMAYDKDYDVVDNYLDKFQTIKNRHTSNVAKPVLELDPKITKEGLYPRYQEDKDKFFEYFVKVSKQFDGATIHQYKAWYQDLYCEQPEEDSTYYFGEPKEC